MPVDYEIPERPAPAGPWETLIPLDDWRRISLCRAHREAHWLPALFLRGCPETAKLACRAECPVEGV